MPAVQESAPAAGGGGVTDGDKGDVTVSSGGDAWVIDASGRLALAESAAFTDRYAPLSTTADYAKPETYGAVGNGVADDTDALLAAIATGKDVWLDKDATYLLRGELPLLAGQTLYGNGATLKRKAQVSSTSTTDVAPGTTSYALASAAGFEVGMHVAFANSTVARNALVAGTSLSTNNPKITAIVGNTITLSDGPNVTFADTADVHSVSRGIVLDDDCRVYDVEVDGNVAGTPWTRWEVQGEMYAEASRSRSIVEGCHFHDLAGEGYQMRGDFQTIRDCIFETVNGNGIHMAAATHPVIDGCRFIDNNLDTGMGHVTGCITFSSTIADAVIVNNYTDGGRSGVGGLSQNDADHVIANNIIRNATDHGIDADDTDGGIEIIGNHIYDCGAPGAVDGGIKIETANGAVAITRNRLVNCDIELRTSANVLCADNTLVGGRINANTLSDSKVTGNLLVGSPGTHSIEAAAGTNVLWQGNTIDLSGDTSLIGIVCSGAATGVTFDSNKVIGGDTGITAIGGGVDVTIRDNRLYGQSGFGIKAGHASGRFEVVGNVIHCTAAGSSWFGIQIPAAGVVCTGNVIRQIGGTASYGIRVLAKAQVIGNTVLGTYTQALQVTAGSTDSSIVGNFLSMAVNDLGTTTQLVYNTVQGVAASSGGKALGVYTSATISTGTASVDVSAADVVDLTLNHAAPAITLANIAQGDSVELVLRHGVVSAPTFVHASLSFKYPGGATPTLSGVVGAIDRLAFENTGAEICVTVIGKAFA